MSDSKAVREGWQPVFKSGTDYEADMVRDRLDSAGIPAAVFSQRDHALSLTVGDLAKVYVLVPEEYVAEAESLLAQEPLTDEELDSAADTAGEGYEEQEGTETEQLLDSGIEKIRFSAPEEQSGEDIT